MTAFTKFTASVAGLAAACTLSLATPAFAAPPTAAWPAPDSAAPAFITRRLRPVRFPRRITATVPGTTMTMPGSGLLSPPVLSFTA